MFTPHATPSLTLVWQLVIGDPDVPAAAIPPRISRESLGAPDNLPKEDLRQVCFGKLQDGVARKCR
jgi:hypothetical protein